MHPNDLSVFSDITLLIAVLGDLSAHQPTKLLQILSPVFRVRNVCEPHPQQFLPAVARERAVSVVHTKKPAILWVGLTSSDGRKLEEGTVLLLTDSECLTGAPTSMPL